MSWKTTNNSRLRRTGGGLWAASRFLRSILSLKIERGGIDAVPEARRRWAVGEDMPEMRPTRAAADLRPVHAVAVVGM